MPHVTAQRQDHERPSRSRAPEAVIVAGGFGTRMLPLTERRPKHLLEVGGVPFLEHQITKLADVGVEHVVLATSYRAELFRPVLGDGERFGVRLTYVTEDEPLGTAGAIRNVAEALSVDPEGAVVILNGDVLSGHDLAAQLADFATPREGRPVDVSLHLVEVPDARAFGCVPTDGSGRVTGFIEKSENPVTRQVNAGCYVFRRRVIDAIPAERAVSVERETFPELVASGAVVVGYVETAYWRDVGSPQALVAASRDVVTGAAPTSAVEPCPGGARLDPRARVAGVVREGSLVLRDAVVEAGAEVRGSIVMAGAVVGAGAVVVDSVVGPLAVVGADAVLEEVAVGDGGVVPEGANLAPGTRVGCGARGPAQPS
jgi:mannose-1-phosphate guanylyltransferase